MSSISADVIKLMAGVVFLHYTALSAISSFLRVGIYTASNRYFSFPVSEHDFQDQIFFSNVVKYLLISLNIVLFFTVYKIRQ